MRRRLGLGLLAALLLLAGCGDDDDSDAGPLSSAGDTVTTVGSAAGTTDPTTATNAGGAPDSFGRSLYIDTSDSAYGPGWKRETSLVFRRPTGAFCYSFWPTNDRSLPGAPRRPAGNGKRYRVTVQGPGVTPDVAWEGAGLHDYTGSAADAAYERRMNAVFDQVVAGDKFCPSQR